MDKEDSYKIYKVSLKSEKLEILKEIFENCGPFRNLDIPVDLKIDIIEITKRISIPFNSDFLYIIKEGNVFSWIGELEKSYRLDKELTTEEYFTIGRLKRGEIIQILGEGDILEMGGYYFLCFDREGKNDIHMTSCGVAGCSIAGLPFEQVIEPVKLIRISLKEIERVFLKNRKRREIFIIKFLTFSRYEKEYGYNFKAQQKISSALRICFLGREPLGWYIEAKNSEVVDNGNKLKKPQEGAFSFVIKTQHLGLMTGLSQPMIDSWLSQKRQKESPFFKKIKVPSQHFKIEKAKGGYKFSLLTFSKKFLAHTCSELHHSLYESYDPMSHDEIEKRYIYP